RAALRRPRAGGPARFPGHPDQRRGGGGAVRPPRGPPPVVGARGRESERAEPPTDAGALGAPVRVADRCPAGSDAPASEPAGGAGLELSTALPRAAAVF